MAGEGRVPSLPQNSPGTSGAPPWGPLCLPAAAHIWHSGLVAAQHLLQSGLASASASRAQETDQPRGRACLEGIGVGLPPGLDRHGLVARAAPGDLREQALWGRGQLPVAQEELLAEQREDGPADRRLSTRTSRACGAGFLPAPGSRRPALCEWGCAEGHCQVRLDSLPRRRHRFTGPSGG